MSRHLLPPCRWKLLILSKVLNHIPCCCTHWLSRERGARKLEDAKVKSSCDYDDVHRYWPWFRVAETLPRRSRQVFMTRRNWLPLWTLVASAAERILPRGRGKKSKIFIFQHVYASLLEFVLSWDGIQVRMLRPSIEVRRLNLAEVESVHFYRTFTDGWD